MADRATIEFDLTVSVDQRYADRVVPLVVAAIDKIRHAIAGMNIGLTVRPKRKVLKPAKPPKVKMVVEAPKVEKRAGPPTPRPKAKVKAKKK